MYNIRGLYVEIWNTLSLYVLSGLNCIFFHKIFVGGSGFFPRMYNIREIFVNFWYILVSVVFAKNVSITVVFLSFNLSGIGSFWQLGFFVVCLADVVFTISFVVCLLDGSG